MRDEVNPRSQFIRILIAEPALPGELQVGLLRSAQETKAGLKRGSSRAVHSPESNFSSKTSRKTSILR
jgi:hypothetical protein